MTRVRQQSGQRPLKAVRGEAESRLGKDELTQGNKGLRQHRGLSWNRLGSMNKALRAAVIALSRG